MHRQAARSVAQQQQKHGTRAAPSPPPAVGSPVAQQLVQVAGKVGVQALVAADHLVGEGEACGGGGGGGRGAAASAGRQASGQAR